MESRRDKQKAMQTWTRCVRKDEDVSKVETRRAEREEETTRCEFDGQGGIVPSSTAPE